jgi:hypothetical protein
MNADAAVRPDDRPRAADRWILIATGLAALAPLIVYHRFFARLYWFGDEFDLLDQIDRLGFWRWMWLVFAENFVPLFKLLWGGAALLSGGSYAAMVALVWLTHALNVMLLGRLMRTCGQRWAAVFAAQAAFALTPANMETLGWTVQWSAVLSALFMLLALDSFLRAPFGRAPIGWGAASALSFSRGVLTGALLAGACPWAEEGAPRRRPPRRVLWALAYLSPAMVVAALIALMATGNHQHMAGHGADAAVFGLWYYCLNPAYLVFSVGSWGWRTVSLLGLCKVALVAWAILRSRGRLRLLIALMVAFDLGNAALLGIGRYHTGLLAAVSSRYQYASLLGIAPAAGFWVAKQWERLPVWAAARRVAFAVVLAGAAYAMCRQWSAGLDVFSTTRGSDSRRLLLVDKEPYPNSVPGIPGLPMDRAKALIAKYGLH